MYVIGLNGPPEAGKDSIAALVAAMLDSSAYTIPVRIVSIVEPLARMGATMLGVEYSDEWYVTTKPQRPVVLKGDTFREWMIRMTEDFFKPRYGPLFWGRVLVNQLRTQGFQGIAIVVNIGFDEGEYFMSEFGEDNCLFVQVNREGKTFAEDSRGWVHGKWNCPLHNMEGHPLAAAEELYTKIVSHKLWALW